MRSDLLFNLDVRDRSSLGAAAIETKKWMRVRTTKADSDKVIGNKICIECTSFISHCYGKF